MKKFVFAPYSPSKLDSAVCPERFRSTYILKMPQPMANRGAADKGTVIHKVFERIFDSRIAGETITFNQVEEWINESVRENPQASPFLDLIRAACVNLFKRSPQELKFLNFVQQTEKSISIKYDGSECDWEDPDCFARAKLDIYCEVGDEAIIIDHKTQPFVEHALTAKMEFYAWLVAKANPHVKKVSVILNFCHPDINWISEPITMSRAEVIFDPNNMMEIREETVEERIMAQINYIESYWGSTLESWPTVPNKDCHYCRAYFNCPARKEVENTMAKAGLNPPKDGNEASQLLRLLMVVEDWSDQLKATLKEYISRKDITHNIVQYSNMIYGRKHYKSYDYNKYPEKIKAILKKLNQDPIHYMEFDKDKLNSLIVTIEDSKILNDFKEAVPEKVTSKAVLQTESGFFKSR